MAALTSVLLLALSQASPASALSARPWRVPEHLRANKRAAPAPLIKSAEALQYDEQLTDHFNPGAMQARGLFVRTLAATQIRRDACV